MEHVIHVTEEHYAKARALVEAWRSNRFADRTDYCELCVVAVALREQWAPDATVGYFSFWREGGARYDLPNNVCLAIADFDNGMPFMPLSFTFDDEEVLSNAKA
jgi:hypothetical protein